MGIKKLFTFLNNNDLYKKYPYLNDLISDLDIDKKKLLVGVDANLFCYKYIHSYDNMLIGFFNQILKFLSNKIIPLYIFDGGTIQEKEGTNISRHHKKLISKYKLDKLEKELEKELELDKTFNKEELLIMKKKLEKNSTKINTENIIILLELFDLLNIPYIFSHAEGEYLAVLLNKYNIIDFFLTDDTDPIPAGINRTIKFYNNSVYFLETTNILKKFKINQNELCDFCILLGSDYAVFNHGLKPHELLKIICEYKTIENIISNNIIDKNIFTQNIYEFNPKIFDIIDKIRNIYFNSDKIEKEMFIDNKNIFEMSSTSDYGEFNDKINLFIDHSNISFYSNIMLEFWDDFIQVLDSHNNDYINKSIEFKSKIYIHISKQKFNIKNIVKFIKNNIDKVTDNEIKNMTTSFEFLNNFGLV